MIRDFFLRNLFILLLLKSFFTDLIFLVIIFAYFK